MKRFAVFLTFFCYGRTALLLFPVVDVGLEVAQCEAQSVVGIEATLVSPANEGKKVVAQLFLAGVVGQRGQVLGYGVANAGGFFLHSHGLDQWGK